jgi:hypothetical protein
MTGKDPEMTIADALTAVGGNDPVEGLRAAKVLRRIAERLESENVARARTAGWTWEEIGDALGVSRQAAHKKHGRP